MYALIECDTIYEKVHEEGAMAKSQITKELIDKKIELSQALERVLVIAMEINDTKTIKWIKQEKN